MFKLALNAGHGLYTPGKRCMKSIDPNETREWSLNSRICDKVQARLADYNGIELIRTDDITGQADISISNRCAAANDFGADAYISVHHNAGINGGSGGGIMAYVYLTVDDTTKNMQKLLYDRLISKTGLSGNRSQPLASADLGECRMTAMPAVLLECGFMDSVTDVPVILSEDFAEKSADAIVEAVVQMGGLERKAQDTQKPAEQDGVLYRVQCGAFSNKENAEGLLKRLKAAGFDAFIKAE